jgi:hypothetical protein
MAEIKKNAVSWGNRTVLSWSTLSNGAKYKVKPSSLVVAYQKYVSKVRRVQNRAAHELAHTSVCLGMYPCPWVIFFLKHPASFFIWHVLRIWDAKEVTRDTPHKKWLSHDHTTLLHQPLHLYLWWLDFAPETINSIYHWNLE